MKVALIGTGMVALTHVRAINDIPGMRLTYLYSRDQHKTRDFAEKSKDLLGYQPEVADSIEQLATNAEIDFIIVLTPPNARHDIIECMAAAGKPVLMEKPIERDAQAARNIVEICEKASVPLGIVFQHRMRASTQKLNEKITQNTFGDLALAEIKVPWWREQAYYDEPGRGSYARDGGGVLISQAIHTLDLLLSLTGPVNTVQAMARTTRLHHMEAEDYVVAGLEFACGAVGSLVASTASFPGEPESIVLHFTKATVHLVAGQLNILWHNGRQENIGEPVATGGGADPMAFTHQWHRHIIEDFAAAITEGRAPVAAGRKVLAVHDLIDALVQSSKEGRTVTVPPIVKSADAMEIME